MIECCRTCKYRHLYKLFKDGMWIKSDCCIVLTREDDCCDDYSSFVIEVNENDRCEMYVNRSAEE